MSAIVEYGRDQGASAQVVGDTERGFERFHPLFGERNAIGSVRALLGQKESVVFEVL